LIPLKSKIGLKLPELQPDSRSVAAAIALFEYAGPDVLAQRN
jgi:hypothetical protein